MRRWLARADELIAAVGPDAADPAVFALRSSLVHEWRKFLFTDPGFPAALLPPNWPGHQAARVFQAGRVVQTAVEMEAGLFVVMTISNGSSLAVLAAAQCDLGLVAYEMGLLVERVGRELTPAKRQ